MKPTKELRRFLGEATARYEEHLALAGDYLLGRGFDEETAVTYHLGVAADPMPGDENVRGRLSIPYLTNAGVVDLRYRCIEDHDCKENGHPKYLGRPEGTTHLFSVMSLFSAGDVIAITEGEMDAMILNQIGIAAVGVPGTGNWKSHYSRLFEDFRRVFLFADGDSAGAKFGKKLASEVGALVIPMPDDYDVNSAYQKFGPEWLRSKIDE